MIREDKICLVLQGLINGVDYENGESYEFSETVLSSLKALVASLECEKRNNYPIDSVESANEFENKYFSEPLKTLPRITHEEYRQINEILGDYYLQEKRKLNDE